MFVVPELRDCNRERHMVEKLPKSIIVEGLRQVRKVGDGRWGGMWVFRTGHVLQLSRQIAVLYHGNRSIRQKFRIDQVAINRIRASMTGWWE